MKYTLHIEEERDEEIIVYAHSKNELVKRLEALINEENLNTSPIIGYIGDDIVEVIPDEVHCFFIEDKRLYASLERHNVLIKRRLYEIENLARALAVTQIQMAQKPLARFLVVGTDALRRKKRTDGT